MALIVQPNFHTPGAASVRDFSPGDDFYQLLIDAHRGLAADDSARLNARLILLLANHVGDLGALREAIALARAGLAAAPEQGPCASEAPPRSR